MFDLRSIFFLKEYREVKFQMSRTTENRYSERRRRAGKGYSGKGVVFILLCCALTVFLLSTSYLGDRLVDKYITPVFAKIMGKTMTPEPSKQSVMAQSAEAMPTATPAMEKIVFEMPESSWYLLQMGAYADPEESVYRRVLDQFYGGREDQRTVRILRSRGEIK